MKASFGIIGNGKTVAVLSSRGSLDWLCCPELDSPSHFSALLDDRSGGRFSIRPSGPFESGQAYLGREGRSAVLETRFSTPTGRGRVIDWMPWNAGSAVLRQVETLEGTICWELFCLPRFHYGQVAPLPEPVWRGIRFRAPAIHEQGRLSGTAEIQLESMLGAAVSRFELAAGGQRRFAWSWGRERLRAEELLEQGPETCIKEWEQWFHICRDSPEGPCCPSDPAWRMLSVRSEATLRLLTHAGTGAFVESPTTSLPRIRLGTQNWDLRYSWLRHAPEVISAWNQLHHPAEARRLWGWLADLAIATPAHEISPALTLDGSLVPDEHELHALRGHEGARPVRIGNASARLFQLDSVAAVLTALERLPEGVRIADGSPLWKKVEELAVYLGQLWRRPDHGVWDLRMRPEHYLSSKIACWKGIQSAIGLLESHQRMVPARWQEEARKIRDTVLREGFHSERQSFTQAFGESELDSSGLLVGLSGLGDPHAPEVLSTLILLQAELREGPFLKRTRNSHASPDLEGCHVLSTLWWAAALVQSGRAEEARDVLDELARLSAPLGFLGEGLDPSSGAPAGNFPSTCAHAFAIPTLQAASRALERARRARRAA